MRLVAPPEYRRMPWKNGGGTTWEVAVHPQGADWSGFDWRVSIAAIERDGAFSSLPGVDRTLVMLAGRGMRLSGVREAPVDMRPFDVVAFAGEAGIDCTLRDGPARDFNAMVRRGAGHASVRVVQGTRDAFSDNATYICHAAAGSCQCLVDASPIEVPEAHTLVADASRLEVDARDDAVAVVVAVVTA